MLQTYLQTEPLLEVLSDLKIEIEVLLPTGLLLTYVNQSLTHGLEGIYIPDLVGLCSW